VAALALALDAAFVALAIGVRVALQLRHSGSTGFHGFQGRPGSTEWWAFVLYLLGFALAPLALLLALLGVLEPIPALDRAGAHVAGVVLACFSIVAVFLSQGAMGESWGFGAKQEARTALVVDGPFAVTRNPIYTLVALMHLALALMVPSVFMLLALVIIVLGIELLVRAVEEPYLLRTHGDVFRDYASRVGRFAPGLGLLDRPR
jgi:protein-S-isoprenylcysteine O-methyltransferase Ste14